MKNVWKRAGALVLALCLAAGLAGCGDKSNQEENKTLAQELGYGYLSEYSGIDDLKMDYVSQVSAAQGKLYLYGEYYDETTYESGAVFYERDLASNSVREIPLPELVSTEDSHEYVQQLSVCADGSGYWIVTNQYTFSMAVPGEEFEEPVAEEPEAEPADSTVEEPFEPGLVIEPDEPVETLPVESGAPETKYYAKRCDMTGQVLQEIDLSEAAADMDYFYCQAAVQDGAGDLYLASDNVILCFGADGSRKADIDTGEMYIQSMVASGDGTIVLSGYDWQNGGLKITRVDGGNLVPLEVEGLSPYGNTTLYPGDGSTLLLSDGTLLYSLDTATGQLTRQLSWLDSDINGGSVAGVAANGADTVLVLLTSYDRTNGVRYELGTLTKTPAEQLPKRTILTLGAEYLDETLQSAIIRFNRNSDTYRITLVDYSVYNTEEDYTAGSKQMDRDVIAGNCPDILSLTSGNAQKYIAKGALTDMAALMEKDGEISRDDLVSGPLQAYEKDGKLYGMPFSFGINTLYASARLVGDRDHWTMSEMAEVIRGLDPEVRIAMWYTQADFLSTMVYQNLNQFVDYGSSSCNFDTDSFRELLEVSSRLPASNEELTPENDTDYFASDEMQKLQAGDLLVTSGYCSGSYEVKNMYRLYTADNGIVRVGYPSDSGNGAVLNIYGGLAISSKCADPDGAWQFVKTMLSDEVQQNQWSFPVTRTAFDKVMAEAMKQDSYQNENGETVYVDSVGYIGEAEYKIGELTQEQADAFLAYVNGATVSGNYDADILNIVTEEAAAYFAGDKTADEVAKLIQNRVTIYLGETS
ncbi:MAG: extracellular solute-binding protein [Oscillospiraceae bacterium]|nr:extracellular solute-binding protein [Oscillospiraceae bacterium]